MTQPSPYESMNEDQLRKIAERNDLLIELIKRIMALPDPSIMSAEEKGKWIVFLSGLSREVQS